RLCPLRRGLATASPLDMFTFYVRHGHVRGDQWAKFVTAGVTATILITVKPTGSIHHADFLVTINAATNKIPKHLFHG
ncbi:major capsid protein, partial [Lysobacter sp. A03]|uniref:major capsid protein n=1 Tax=Lysobacter sp. A03 TaxID=1199154 RepID=UPI0031B61EE2